MARAGVTEGPLPLLPSEEDVASYRELGFYVSEVVLSAEVLEAARRGMTRFYEGDRDHPFPDLQVEGDPSVQQHWQNAHGWSDGPGLRKNDYASRQVKELAALVHQPAIGAIAARLCGVDGVRLWHDQLIFKPVDLPQHPAAVGWHTDRQYWQMCSSDEMLTAWVPFHDVDEKTGPIAFLAGSHRWAEIEGLSFFEHDLDSLENRIKASGHRLEVRRAPLRAGQMTFHHCRTVHGSAPNRSTGPRHSISIHLQPPDNHYRVAYGPDGRVIHHTNYYICRQRGGAPDYGDPLICPQLWPTTEPWHPNGT